MTLLSQAPVGIVAGSGIELDSLLDTVTRRCPFDETPGLDACSIQGHGNAFVHGACGAYRLILQCGRLHMYEGFSYAAVARTVDALHACGVRAVLFTNAAGGLLPEMVPGDLLAVEGVKLAPYRHWSERPDSLSTDYVIPNCDFEGTYFWVHGPCYETRAEIAALQELGAAAVGMSIAPELRRCRELGIRAGAVSCITNSCCRPEVLTHKHIVATARDASRKLAEAIRAALPVIAGE